MKDKCIGVTGGAGFIGSQFISYLNSIGIENIILFDELTHEKYDNVKSLQIKSFEGFDRVFDYVKSKEVNIIVHLGAISSTTYKNPDIMEKNTNFTLDLINCCVENKAPIVYASSASVYGNSGRDRRYDPLCMYAYSKYRVDVEVENLLESHRNYGMEPEFPIIGLRFTNVFGPGETHKGSQASVIYNWHKQIKNGETPKIFEGEYKRDFVYVNDVCDAIENFIHQALLPSSSVYRKESLSGIYDVGSFEARNFKEIAAIMEKRYNVKFETIPFPKELKKQYQTFTQGKKDELVNYRITPFETAINEYLDYLDGKQNTL